VNHRIAWLDVFSEESLAGNGLAVVDDADGIDDETMLAVAKEMGLSETTFVQTAGETGAHYRNRIFTPERELPFAGHPSLGTGVAVARWRGTEDADFTQQTGAGLQEVSVVRDGGPWNAAMLQNPPEFGSELDVAAVMATVGLDAAEAHPDLPPQIVSTGLPTAIVPVLDESSVGRAAPDLDAIDAALADAEPRAGETPNFYLVSVDTDAGEARARMFSTAVPSGEDPATGSAAGPLGAYLFERAALESVAIRQGVEMGRPSTLQVAMENGRPTVSGGVVPLIDGEISLP
jgi:trans-2,3-dihydro-3-hydroxyanthranilate isomerase